MGDRAQAAVGATLNDIQKRLPPWARATILSGLCGSHVHGTWLPPDDPNATDDVGEWGVARVEQLATNLDAEFRAAVEQAKKSGRFRHQPDAKVINRIVRDVLETQWLEVQQP